MGDSFFTFYHPEYSSRELEVPKLFVSSFLSSVPEQFILESTKGISTIVARKNGNSLFFSGGWPSFVKKNNLLEGDFLTFHFEGESRFEVKIFGLHACRKDADMSDISGTTRSIWAASSRGLVSPLLRPKEELKSGSEEEGSGGYDGLNAGTSRRKKVTTKFPPQPRVKNCSRGGVVSPLLHLQSSSEEGGLGGYSGAARRRRRALSSSPEDGIRGARGKVRRSRTPPCRFSSGTLRSNKVATKFPPQTSAKNHRSGCGMSSVLRPAEELLYRSEEEGQDVYGGDAQRMGRTPLPTTEDDSTDDGSRGGGTEIWREKTLHRRLSSGRDGPKAGTSRSNKVLQSSSQRMGRTPLPTTGDDNRGGGREIWRVRLSGGRDGPKAGTSRSNKVLQSSSQRMGRTPLPTTGDDSTDDDNRGGGREIWRERTLPRRLSGGRDGPKAGTSRSNKVLQSSSQRMGRTPLPTTGDDSTDDDNRGGGREIWRERTLPRRLSGGRDGPKAGTSRSNKVLQSSSQRMGRTPLPTTGDDSTDDDNRGGGREIWRERTLPRRLSGGRDGPKAGTSRSNKVLPSSSQRMGRTPLPTTGDDSTDDGSRGGGREILRERTLPQRLSNGKDGPKAGALRINRATTRYDPPSRSRNRGSGGLLPEEELRSGSEEEAHGGYSGAVQRVGRASLPTSEDDSSDGSRGGDRKIRRNRTPTRHLSSGRHGPKPGVSEIHKATTKFAPHSQASKEEWSRWLSRQNSATGQTSRPGLKDDRSNDSRGSGGRIQSRTPLRRLSSGRDGPKAGVLSIHRATARFDPPSSGCGASARLRPKEEPRSSSEEEGRGGYARGGAQQMGRASCSGQKRWRED